jgi:hypothetical protein
VIDVERLRLGERRVDLTAQVALRQRGAMIGEDVLRGQQRDLSAAAAVAIGLDRPRRGQSAADDNELELLRRVLHVAPPSSIGIVFLQMWATCTLPNVSFTTVASAGHGRHGGMRPFAPGDNCTRPSTWSPVGSGMGATPDICHPRKPRSSENANEGELDG